MVISCNFVFGRPGTHGVCAGLIASNGSTYAAVVLPDPNCAQSAHTSPHKRKFLGFMVDGSNVCQMYSNVSTWFEFIVHPDSSWPSLGDKHRWHPSKDLSQQPGSCAKPSKRLRFAHEERHRQLSLLSLLSLSAFPHRLASWKSGSIPTPNWLENSPNSNEAFRFVIVSLQQWGRLPPQDNKISDIKRIGRKTRSKLKKLQKFLPYKRNSSPRLASLRWRSSPLSQLRSHITGWKCTNSTLVHSELAGNTRTGKVVIYVIIAVIVILCTGNLNSK